MILQNCFSFIRVIYKRVGAVEEVLQAGEWTSDNRPNYQFR